MSKVQLNKSAPEIEMIDYQGQLVKLSNFRGKKNIVLIFNRGFT